MGDFREALRILRRGASVVPRYGPIALSGVRVAEQLCIEQELEYDEKIIKDIMSNCDSRPTEATLRNAADFLYEARSMAEESIVGISRELLWKIYFELGGVEERGAQRLSLRVERFKEACIR